jgi:anti-anti-sigma regulatory factor
MQDPTAFRLPPALDLNAAEPLRDALLALPSEAALLLDGSQVEAAATPGLQVLAAAARMAASRGRSFRLLDPSPPLAAAIADLGLANILNGAS